MPDPNSNQDAVVSDYHKQREQLFINLKKLPPVEMHYYFALLIAIIENETDPQEHTDLLIKANEVVIKLNHYYEAIRNNEPPDLMAVTAALNDLIITSRMQSLGQRIKGALLTICSFVLGFIIGIVGAITGFFGSLFSEYTAPDVHARGVGWGFLAGLILGSRAGAHSPNLIFKKPFERKLEFCINSIDKIGKELSTKKTHKVYEEETKKYILDVFFKDTPDTAKEAAFQAFLESTNEQFQVSTTTAGFLSPHLKGYLGHHSLIAFSINGKQDIPMEFGDRKKMPGFFDQNESPRRVTGKKLFDMLVLDRILQETYEHNFQNIMKDYDIGSNDCKTYVNKLLIGTNQAPTQINSFNPEHDKWIGVKVVAPVVQFFNKTKETELSPIIKYYKEHPDDPDPVITSRKWEGKKKTEPEVQKEPEGDAVSNPKPTG